MERYDAVIIGGGIAGLTAALYLAKEGKKTAVLEKSSRFGGRAMTINKNGVLMNLGAHALYKGGEADKIFEELGVSIKGNKPSVAAQVIWKNDVYQVPMGWRSLFSKQFLTLSGKLRLVKLMVHLYKMDLNSVPHESLQTWAEREIADPMVRHFFFALCRTATYTHAANIQLARPVIRQVQRVLKEGVFYADYGWESIINELKSKAAQYGAKLHETAGVERIDCNGEVKRVWCPHDHSFEAHHVIMAVPPHEACRLIPNSEKTSLYRWKEEALSVTASCFDMGLKTLPNKNHQFAIGLDQPVFFTNQSRAAKLSNDGKCVVSLVKYHDLTRTHLDLQSEKQQLDAAMDLLHPGWKKEAAEQQYLPKITIVHNFPHTGRTENPGPAVPEIKGIYIAGDWAGHEELLADAAAASAKRAAMHILKGDKVSV
ncbi:FAD-dependent oxidoreductase [Metabacillus sp. GX 13764]|uniref:phytoene desaturase family protein n=1 Tax=Metabacillus kandeliae TaxID=2900151 RepID=UPI001E5B5A0B|nr:FAD-dependent oxidoreductase [Metabacillus kandeliae]MCD7034420.1 FAD-dependent oxidoreductase [Metabacillus kandeliae]